MIVVDNTRNCTIFSLFLFYLTGTVCTPHKNIKNSRINMKFQGYWTKGEVRCFFDLNSKRILWSSYFSKRAIWCFSADYMSSEFFKNSRCKNEMTMEFQEYSDLNRNSWRIHFFVLVFLGTISRINKWVFVMLSKLKFDTIHEFAKICNE